MAERKEISPSEVEDIRRRLSGPENQLLTPAEVGTLFRVSPKTVTRWASTGKLRCEYTLGGHRRFRVRDIKEAMRSMETHMAAS